MLHQIRGDRKNNIQTALANSYTDTPWRLSYSSRRPSLCAQLAQSRIRHIFDTNMAVGAIDGASSITVAVRVRPFTIREAAQLTRVDDGPLFLGDGSLAAAPVQRHAGKGIRSVIKVMDEKCLYVIPALLLHGILTHLLGSSIRKTHQLKDDCDQAWEGREQKTSLSPSTESLTTTQPKPKSTKLRPRTSSTVSLTATTPLFLPTVPQVAERHTPSRTCYQRKEQADTTDTPSRGTAQQPGIIFLTMQEMFERIGEMQEEKQTEVTLSYLEIYNETIRDLLIPVGEVTKRGQGLMLREDANQAVSVAGLTSHRPQNVRTVQHQPPRPLSANKYSGERSYGHAHSRKRESNSVTHRGQRNFFQIPRRPANQRRPERSQRRSLRAYHFRNPLHHRFGWI